MRSDFGGRYPSSLPARIVPWLNAQHHTRDTALKAEQKDARRAGEAVSDTAQLARITLLRRTDRARVPRLPRALAARHHGVPDLDVRCPTVRPSGDKSSPSSKRPPSRLQNTQTVAISSFATHGMIAKAAPESYTPNFFRTKPQYGSAKMTSRLDH